MSLGDVLSMLEAIPAWLQQMSHLDPWLFTPCFVGSLALCSALSIPVCAALIVVGLAYYDPITTLLLVGTASTLGAMVSFAASRYWGRSRLEARHQARLDQINQGLAQRGLLYLVGLRLLPLVPYPVLNPLLGISRVSSLRFVWTSWLGLTLASLPYVLVGQGLLQLIQG